MRPVIWSTMTSAVSDTDARVVSVKWTNNTMTDWMWQSVLGNEETHCKKTPSQAQDDHFEHE